MKLFRIVGFVKNFKGEENPVYENWGKANLSIDTMNKLANLYNIKYVNWYLEYKEV